VFILLTLPSYTQNSMADKLDVDRKTRDAAQEALEKRVYDLETRLASLEQINLPSYNSQIINLNQSVSYLNSSIASIYAKLDEQKAKVELPLVGLSVATSNTNCSLEGSGTNDPSPKTSHTTDKASTGILNSSRAATLDNSRPQTTVAPASEPRPSIIVLCKQTLLDFLLKELYSHITPTECMFVGYAADLGTKFDVEPPKLTKNTQVLVCTNSVSPRNVSMEQLNKYINNLYDKGLQVFVLFMVYGTEMPDAKKLSCPYAFMPYQRIDVNSPPVFTFTTECQTALEAFVGPSLKQKKKWWN